MVPSVGMDPGEYCTWGLQDSSGTDISKVMWLEQRNQTDTAGTETAGTVTMHDAALYRHATLHYSSQGPKLVQFYNMEIHLD